MVVSQPGLHIQDLEQDFALQTRLPLNLTFSCPSLPNAGTFFVCLVYVCAYVCRCPRKPEVLDFPGAGLRRLGSTARGAGN